MNLTLSKPKDLAKYLVLSLGGLFYLIIFSDAYNEIRQLKTKKYYPNQTFVVGGTKDYIIRPNVDGAVTQSNTQDLARKAVVLQPTSDIKAITFNTYKAEINPNAPQGTSIQGMQTMDFKHHVRGGLLGINLDNAGNSIPKASEGDLFSYKLEYETTGFYDGNIGKQTWQNVQNNAPLGLRSFSYLYNENSTLKSATYTGIGAENFSMPNISYDKNGNITNLQRKGKNGSSFGDIDNLTYNYNGNRLVGVTDGINSNEDVGDFRDNGSNTDYTYWSDGALKSDANKGISLIEYDTYLQKVKQVSFSNGNWVKFFYSSSGTLIKRTNSLGDVWAYTPKAIYKNGVLYQVSQSEGRVLLVANVWVYEFEYRDHQNNLRVAFKADNGTLVQTQTQEQDPFGLEIKPLSSQNSINSNQFKFLNRQDIPELNGVSDLVNRFYDKQIGRFWSIDPKVDDGQHSFTPYHYSFNNPVFFSDPNGLMGEGCCQNLIDFASGTIDAILTDNIPVATNYVMSNGNHSYSAGVKAGHILSVVGGAAQIIVGAIGDVGAGGLEVATAGVATPVAVPLAMGSTATVLNGISTLTKAITNLNSEGKSQGGSDTKQRNKPKEEGTPNSSEIQSKDKNGKTDKYTTYDENGKIIKEYRGSGKEHGNIPRPNVKEPKYNINPKTGEKFQNGYEVRKAKSNEIPK